MAKISKEEIINALKEMTLLEINDLVKSIEKEFNVSAVMQAAPAAAAKTDAPETVNVILTKIDQTKKIQAIKIYREITGVGLGEAKTAVESSSAKIKEGIKPAEAEEIKKKFAEIGAEVKIEA
jgi:large subunit ribosomal protein L7/L12